MDFYINPTHLTRPIGSSYALREEAGALGISQELAMISAALKKALNGISGWIEMYPLMRSLRKTLFQNEASEDLRSCTEELELWADLFSIKMQELKSYIQQLPEPRDVVIALDMQRALERSLGELIAEDTTCDLGGHGKTSLGALLLSDVKVEWTQSVVDILLSSISSEKWRSVKTQLKEVQSQLL